MVNQNELIQKVLVNDLIRDVPIIYVIKVICVIIGELNENNKSEQD